jgi:hypothetical protein
MQLEQGNQEFFDEFHLWCIWPSDERIDVTSFFDETKYMARSPVVLTVVSQSKCKLIQVLFNCLFLYF